MKNFHLAGLILTLFLGLWSCKSDDGGDSPGGGDLGEFLLELPLLSRGEVVFRVTEDVPGTAVPNKATLVLNGADQESLSGEPPYEFTVNSAELADNTYDVAVRLEAEGTSAVVVSGQTLVDNVLLSVSIDAGYVDAVKDANDLMKFSRHWYITDTLGNILSNQANWDEGSTVVVNTNPDDENFIFKLAIIDFFEYQEGEEVISEYALNYQDILSLNNNNLTYSSPTAPGDTEIAASIEVTSVPQDYDSRYASNAFYEVTDDETDGRTVTYDLLVAQGDEIAEESFIPTVVFMENAGGEVVAQYYPVGQDDDETIDFTNMSAPSDPLTAAGLSGKSVSFLTGSMLFQGQAFLPYGAVADEGQTLSDYETPFNKTNGEFTGDFFQTQVLGEDGGNTVLWEVYGENIVQGAELWSISENITPVASTWASLRYDQRDFNNTTAFTEVENGNEFSSISAQFVYTDAVEFTADIPDNITATYGPLVTLSTANVQSIEGLVLGDVVTYPNLGEAQNTAIKVFDLNPVPARMANRAPSFAFNNHRRFPNFYLEEKLSGKYRMSSGLMGMEKRKDLFD
ncbi:hypothetical protein [Persicobacter diffluens]|uniref:Uncharacterized protein n=1 Tax=Persicobacter diffluens TaxID=981 RepID=A0AAN5ANC2_9BACT|nr:hypothetical protein PEDI_37580 [Persicobacter diffluens]